MACDADKLSIIPFFLANILAILKGSYTAKKEVCIAHHSWYHEYNYKTQSILGLFLYTQETLLYSININDQTSNCYNYNFILLNCLRDIEYVNIQW